MEEEYFYSWFNKNDYSEEKVISRGYIYGHSLRQVIKAIEYGPRKINDMVLIKINSSHCISSDDCNCFLFSAKEAEAIEFIYLTEEKFNQYLMLV